MNKYYQPSKRNYLSCVS